MSGMDPGKGSESWYNGGVPTKLWGFDGDDGFVSFKAGEGIVSPKGMDNLGKINSGDFGGDQFGIAALKEELRMIKEILKSGFMVSNKNSNDTKYFIQKIDAIGLRMR